MILPQILSAARPLIAHHLVTKGRRYANIIGEPPIDLEEGDVVVFTRGNPHMLSSSAGMRENPLAPTRSGGTPKHIRSRW